MSQSTRLTDGRTYRQTDRQTESQSQYRAYASQSHGKNVGCKKTSTVSDRAHGRTYFVNIVAGHRHWACLPGGRYCLGVATSQPPATGTAVLIFQSRSINHGRQPYVTKHKECFPLSDVSLRHRIMICPLPWWWVPRGHDEVWPGASSTKTNKHPWHILRTQFVR